ncbi:MAG: tRNA (adenosine(37)-N6)-threonylcarbamoyltransferase complex dimerization subunit type 1 TsaB [Methylococcales bacterium]
MKILAIETATEACSAALLIDDNVTEHYQFAPRQQSELILPMVDELMSKAGLSALQLDAIAFGRGPGAFTGVRLAAAVTQGIAFATGLPVIPVSTLAAMAEYTFLQHNTEYVYTAIDARMKEIYWAVFTRQQDNLVAQQAEAVIAPEQVNFTEKLSGIGVGSGWETYQDILTEKLGTQLVGIEPDVFPRAASIARLGARLLKQDGAVLADQAIPVYLRNKVTHRSGGR